jgi:hypothetical protein
MSYRYQIIGPKKDSVLDDDLRSPSGKIPVPVFFQQSILAGLMMKKDRVQESILFIKETDII